MRVEIGLGTKRLCRSAVQTDSRLDAIGKPASQGMNDEKAHLSGHALRVPFAAGRTP